MADVKREEIYTEKLAVGGGMGTELRRRKNIRKWERTVSQREEGRLARTEGGERGLRKERRKMMEGEEGR